ncbi:hypothetical protein LCGC14_2845160, partial [marine sediment metagenome]
TDPPAITTIEDKKNDGIYTSFDFRSIIDEVSSFEMNASFNRQKSRLHLTACGPQAFSIPEGFDLYLIDQDLAFNSILNIPVSEEPVGEEAIIAENINNYYTTYGTDLYSFLCIASNSDTTSERSDIETQYNISNGPLDVALGAATTVIRVDSQAYFSGINEQESYRIFAQSSYSGETMTLNSGALVQKSSNIDEAVLSWRTGVNWHVKNNQMIRFLVSSNYRIPSLMETDRFWTLSGPLVDQSQSFAWGAKSSRIYISSMGNHELEPEKIYSRSIGYYTSTDDITFDIKLFYDEIHNPVLDELRFIHGAKNPVNGDSFTLKGAETEIKLNLSSSLSVHINYSYLDNNSTSYAETSLHSRHAGSFAATYEYSPQHNYTFIYVGNDTISGFTYDRFDLIW